MSTKRVLVYGGNGALGDSIVKYFKEKNYVCFFFNIFIASFTKYSRFSF